MADFSPKKTMKDDVLKVIRILSLDFLDKKKLRALLACTSCLYIVCSCIELFYFLEKFDVAFFAQYCSVFCWRNFATVTMLIFIFKPDVIRYVPDEIDLWSEDSAGPAICGQIRLESTIVSILAVITAMCSMISTVFWVIPDVNDIHFLLIINLCYAKFFKVAAQLIECVLRLTMVWSGYTMIVSSFQIVYGTQHARYQILMLSKHLRDLVKDYEDQFVHCELYENLEYQQEVRRRLIFCAKRYKDILIFSHGKIDDIRSFVPLFIIFAVLLAVSCIIVVLSGVKIIITPLLFWRVGFAAIALGGVVFSYLQSGQSFENVASDGFLSKAIENPAWYTWNRNNKQIYLIIHRSLLTQLQIKFTDNFAINYQTGVAIVKSICSVGCVVYKLSQ